MDPRNVFYTKTRLRKPSTEQSSRRPPHRKKSTCTPNCFIGRHPGTGSTLTRIPVASRTIRRHLPERHLGSWRPSLEWSQVVFTDESRFNVSSDDNRIRVWRRRGECLNPAFALQRHAAPTAGVRVWGSIGYNTRSPLVLIRCTTTDQRFVSNRAYLESLETASWASYEFERTRGKVTENLERNVPRHHAELVCLNARSYKIVQRGSRGPTAAVQFSRARHHSKWGRRWVGVSGSTSNGRRYPKCPLARRLRMVREDTGAPNEGATCTWMAADEAFGCKRAFFKMWRSSGPLVCRGLPERVNDLSRIYWSQHLHSTQSKRPN
ncbi:transposable element Tcb1 transposase [Trichonephila clavipes]|nr:transposable element Tcb1 transposase [Trichonephila clavipes]